MWYAAKMNMLERISGISDVIIDSYFVIDAQRTIIHFNKLFFAMLPRAVTRQLKGKKCNEVLNLDICEERCIALQCWKAEKSLRFDEIGGVVAGADRRPERSSVGRARERYPAHWLRPARQQRGRKLGLCFGVEPIHD